ncbi:MAG: putative secreted hydrolase [Cellvibrionaceae bacterium]|jgi:predicted secreted hydrolase
MAVSEALPFKIMKRSIIFIVILGLLIAGYLYWRSDSVAAVPAASVTEFLSGESSDAFARALAPNAIEFPQDLGAHPDYQTEWWYYTGNLEGENGRRFGYQFTIFRQALAPEVETDSDENEWRTSQVWFAHFTISDIESGEFYFFEKFSRGAAGLAGAQAEPYQVWVEDWQVAEQPDGRVHMQAQNDVIGLDLMLTQTRPPVLHGRGGLSQKGATVGNASYYYSQIDQQSSGTVTINGESFAVDGHSWKDHEYSTSVLEEGAIGWDWVSLQFDNDAANGLMLFQIRRDDGSIQPESAGSFIDELGLAESVSSSDFSMEVIDTWTSSKTGIVYPAGWRIQIPAQELDITGYPLINDQELVMSTVYWEGAVQFEGTLKGEPVTAEGYFELTGYTAE